MKTRIGSGRGGEAPGRLHNVQCTVHIALIRKRESQHFIMKFSCRFCYWNTQGRALIETTIAGLNFRSGGAPRKGTPISQRHRPI